MHAKDSCQSGLKRQILIMLLCTPVGIAKKRPMVHFFLPSFSHSLKFCQECRLCIRNDTEPGSLFPLRCSHWRSQTIVNYISTANFLMKKFSADNGCSQYAWSPLLLETAPFIPGAGFSPERGFPWQLLHGTGKSCLVCFIGPRIH